MRFLVPFLILPLLAAAPPGSDPQDVQWFESLKQPDTGVSCCGAGDAHLLTPEEVRQVHASDHEIEVLIDGQWLPVPPNKVLQRADNPKGVDIAFVFEGQVICFIRGIET